MSSITVTKSNEELMAFLGVKTLDGWEVKVQWGPGGKWHIVLFIPGTESE